MTYEECNIASYSVGNTPTELKRERGSLVSPHHNRWNFHRGPTNLKILPSLSEGRRTPSKLITSKLTKMPTFHLLVDLSTVRSNPPTVVTQCILGLSDGAASLLLIPLNQKYNSLGAPLLPSESIAFISQG